MPVREASKVEHRIQDLIMDQEAANMQSSWTLETAFQRSADQGARVFDQVMRNATWKLGINAAFHAAGGCLPFANRWLNWSKESVEHASKTLMEATRVAQPWFEMWDIGVQKERDLLQHRESSITNLQRYMVSQQDKLTALLQQLNNVKNPLQ